MYIHVKRLIKRLKKRREWEKARRASEYRASSLALKLVLSGSLQSCRRGVTVIGRARKLLACLALLVTGCATVPAPPVSRGVLFVPCTVTVRACAAGDRCRDVEKGALCQEDGK